MAYVSTTTDYVDLDGDYGTVEGVEVTCTKCGHSEGRGGSVDLNRFRSFYKWFSASVTPPPLWALAG